MDVYERRVLRRKRPFLADLLGFSVSDQKKYKNLGLLTDAMIPGIMVETTEFGQVFKFLEGISHKKGALEKLYSILEDHGLNWMVGEMKVEVMQEKGELEVEEYIYREAGMIVQRQFGDTTRISEVDKKEIQLLLALRYQAGKESWCQHINEVKGQCQRAEDWKLEECSRLKEMVDKVNSFLRLQQKHINSLLHDKKNAPEILREDTEQEFTEDTDYLALLEDTMDSILLALSRILLEKENMTDERKKCLEILHINKPATQLDTILHFALSNAEVDKVNAKREAELSDKMVQSLDSRMKAMKVQRDRDLMEKERHIAHLDHVISEKEAQIRAAERKMKDMTQKWQESTEELKKWKTRTELLEKTRRLGYYTPGWYDRLYNINGIDYGRQTSQSAEDPPLVQRTVYNRVIEPNPTFTKAKVTLTRSASCSKSPLFQRKQITFVKDKRPVSSGIHLSKKEGKLARSLGTSLTHVSSLNC